MTTSKLNYLTLITIIITGFVLRTAGINWDANQHLHPDERFLTMVTQAITWPESLSSYFSTQTSTANPHNIGYPFFVYGTFPIFIIKALSQITHLNSYNSVTLVGRFTSALLDTSIILLVYLISHQVFKNKIAGIFSAFFYTLSTLPIQLSHFYAVDTFMVAGLYGCFFFIQQYFLSPPGKKQYIYSVLSGIFLGISLASKISAGLFLPIVGIAFIASFIRTKNWFQVLFCGAIFVFATLLILRVAQPYLFTGLHSLNSQVVENWKQLKSFDNKDGWYPPSVQWINTLPLIFPTENLLFWGLGIPMTVLALGGIVYALAKIRQFPLSIWHISWIIGIFVYQGLQLAKPLRYFYPLYPSLAVLSGPILLIIISRLKNTWLQTVAFLILISWPVAFISIYSRPHTRVAATQWINQFLPAGSTLSCEHWDDCLPLGNSGKYSILQLTLYDPDTTNKWQAISNALSEIDYIILSSNRLYGSITTVPDKYPITSKFYSDLFSGRLGFRKIIEFTSRPNLPLPGFKLCFTPPGISYGKVAFNSDLCPLSGISFVDDYADETWTVYDHPKVIIFQKVSWPPQIAPLPLGG